MSAPQRVWRVDNGFEVRWYQNLNTFVSAVVGGYVDRRSVVTEYVPSESTVPDLATPMSAYVAKEWPMGIRSGDWKAYAKGAKAYLKGLIPHDRKGVGHGNS